MKLLLITTSIPYPPTSGGAIRVHGLVEGLRHAGHDVTLLAFHEGALPDVPSGLRVLPVEPPTRRKTDRLRDLLLTRQADIAKRFFSEAMAARLRELLYAEKFDLVQFEGIESVCYQPLVAEIQPQAKRVFDTFNAEYDLQRTIFHIDRKQPKRLPAAIYSFLQIGRIQRYEGAMCRLANAVIAVSEEDAALLRPFRADHQCAVIPNGIWVDRYVEQTDNPFDTPHNLVFTGKMDYRPNVDAMLWFTEAILPKLNDAHLTIVGQQPHARLSHLRDLPNVTLTGFVDSVLPYLHHADVYIAPLRMGSGTRLKLLEAMACGCAIVATSAAAAGLMPSARESMCLRDEADDFAAEITDLLADAPRRARLGTSAREQVRAHYDWSALMPRLLDVYRSLGLDD